MKEARAGRGAASVTLDTVDGALHALELVSERGTVSVKDIAAELGCSRSSAYRVVRTLQGRGWLSEARFGSYELGPRAAMLGVQAFHRSSLREIALPTMRALVEEFAETATLSVLVGRERVCVEQVESPRDVRMTVKLGQAYPLYAGATGKAILMALDPEERASYLREVPRRRLTKSTVVERRALERALDESAVRGYVVSVAERDAEAFAVAAPIYDRNGVTGAIALSGPVSRFVRSSAPLYGRALLDAAAKISAQLGAASITSR